ncbi:MAG TPA: heme ABC transporter permease CcmC [Verrucomicrobiae bacterium]|nr:heme ABC transporter permease CcmC [Verrucomicrobiae bacterium]
MKLIPHWLHRLSSPPVAYGVAGACQPWLGLASVVLLGYGFLGGLILAPADYQQGDGYRIIFVHVPAAALSILLIWAMAFAGVIALVWRIKLAEVFVICAAPVGASLTTLTLVTGMLWGKPMWGAYWSWHDARLVSELVLLFMYWGVIALNQAIADPRAAARACSLLAIVGAINAVIVKYSVAWWNTLHQGPTLKLGGSSIDSAMLWPLLAAMAGLACFSGLVIAQRLRNELLWRERGNPWARDAIA